VNRSQEEIFKVILYLLVVLAVLFGLAALIAWLFVWVARGFGYEIPFWPVVGSVFLFWLVVNCLRRIFK
jgi:hypothetical protein